MRILTLGAVVLDPEGRGVEFQCLNGIHADSNRAYGRMQERPRVRPFQCLNGIHADSNRNYLPVRGAQRGGLRFQCLNGIHADSNET